MKRAEGDRTSRAGLLDWFTHSARPYVSGVLLKSGACSLHSLLA